MVYHCFNLCICRNFRFVYSRFFWKGKTDKKDGFYVTALFPTLRYDRVVCILRQLNPRWHFSVCFGHCLSETADATMKTKLYRSYFVEQLAKKKNAVCKCVCVFFLFFWLFKDIYFMDITAHPKIFKRNQKMDKKMCTMLKKHWHLWGRLVKFWFAIRTGIECRRRRAV